MEKITDALTNADLLYIPGAAGVLWVVLRAMWTIQGVVAERFERTLKDHAADMVALRERHAADVADLQEQIERHKGDAAELRELLAKERDDCNRQIQELRDALWGGR